MFCEAVINELKPLVMMEEYNNSDAYSKEEIKTMCRELVKLASSEKAKKLIKNNINIDKKVRFGKPTIKNTRITVEDIANMVFEGYNVNDILEQYPSLDCEEQVYAALLYYFNHYIRNSLRFKVCMYLGW